MGVMAGLDLERTYLSLDGQGQVRTHAVEGFWESVTATRACSAPWWAAMSRRRTGRTGRCIGGRGGAGAHRGADDADLDEPGGETARGDDARGDLHRAARRLAPGDRAAAQPVVGITYGAGTEHKAI
jgi:hypothetical protein